MMHGHTGVQQYIFRGQHSLPIAPGHTHLHTHTQHMQKALANGADPHSLETSSGRTALHKVLGDGNLDDGNWVS